MVKLVFDPITCQFSCRCRSEESAPATTAGFGWDPIRRRFYTEYPIKHLLADALETTAFHERPDGAGGSRRYAPGTAGISEAKLPNPTHDAQL
jgi:hypothetical protein